MNRKDAKNLDALFASTVEYFASISAVSVAMGQGGDFVGGRHGSFGETLYLKRKVMNSFFCSVDRPFQFVGRMNDDVNTYVALGNRGALFLSYFNAAVEQDQTQHNDGGLTAMYLDLGTYAKSFYTVMYSPSCVTISEMGANHRRIHHRINWDAAVPKIMNERYRKAGHDGRTP
jgi:hypothetical protein